MELNPIILIEDDDDDCEFFKTACEELNIQNEIVIINNSADAYNYLLQLDTKPFFIICDVNMPLVNGLELRHKVNENKMLRLKAIPFLIWSTAGLDGLVNHAYSMNIQGFFKKPDNKQKLKEMITVIVNYWNVSHHPLV